MKELNNFEIKEENIDKLNLIFVLKKEYKILLPPDLLYFYINHGQILKKDINYAFNGELFHSSFTIESVDEFIEFNKSKVPNGNLLDFLVYATTYDVNCFLLIGCNEENLNKLYLYNNAIEDQPVFICENLFKFFKEILKPW